MTETQKYTIGIDFGTESARAILVNVRNGAIAASAVYRYSHGVITEELPDSHIELGPDWVLQHPIDYINALKRTVPKIMRESQIDPNQVIGIGVDFTGSTVIPTTDTGTPLALINEYKDEPHAWPKLWKHHAAQDKADQITQLGNERFEAFMDRYGGRALLRRVVPRGGLKRGNNDYANRSCSLAGRYFGDCPNGGNFD